MKKLFIISALLIISALSTWSQEASFTIYPEASGTFKIWYSTKNAAPGSLDAVKVDWGDGVLKSYSEENDGGSDPTNKILGTVTANRPIIVYSNFIESILISNNAKAIQCEANNPVLAYIYYFQYNLSSEALEHLYMSLTKRNGKVYGELHLSQQTSIALAGDNILKSNAFIATDKNWQICSMKAYAGENRINWTLHETAAKLRLIPAITLQTPTTANVTDLQLGIKEIPNYPYSISTSLIRIEDGTENHKPASVSSYSTTIEFTRNAPKLTIKGTNGVSVIKIYGALLSHFRTKKISTLDITNISNLRYLNVNISANSTSVPGLENQKLLEYLDLSDNLSLKSVNVEASKNLTELRVEGCPQLNQLKFDQKSLHFLNINKCVSLAYMALPTLRFATDLENIHANNLGWDACTMNAFYNNLSSSPSSTNAQIHIHDVTYTTPPNDWEGSNKTIATDKGWIVYGSMTGGLVSLTGDGGGCIPEGISEVEADSFIALYPNPATDIVNISIKQNLNAESLQVIDFTGKTIFTVPVTSAEHQINVSDYAKGIYLIRIGNITRKLFVK